MSTKNNFALTLKGMNEEFIRVALKNEDNIVIDPSESIPLFFFSDYIEKEVFLEFKKRLEDPVQLDSLAHSVELGELSKVKKKERLLALYEELFADFVYDMNYEEALTGVSGSLAPMENNLLKQNFDMYIQYMQHRV